MRWDLSGDPTEPALLVELAVAAAGSGPEPATIELLTAAADRLRQLDAPDRARLAPMVTTQLQALARAELATSWQQLADLERDVQALGSRSSRRALRRSDDPALDEAVLALDAAVSHLRTMLGRLEPHAPDDLQAAYAATLQQVARLQAALQGQAQLSWQRRARRDQRHARSQPPEQP